MRGVSVGSCARCVVSLPVDGGGMDEDEDDDAAAVAVMV